MAIDKKAHLSQRAQEIREFLLNLPAANHSPMINYDALVKEVSFFEGLIKGLFAFIDKLRRFTAKEYLQWFYDAFSNVTAQAQPGSGTVQTTITEPSLQVPSEKPASVNTQKENQKRKKTSLPITL